VECGGNGQELVKRVGFCHRHAEFAQRKEGIALIGQGTGVAAEDSRNEVARVDAALDGALRGFPGVA